MTNNSKIASIEQATNQSWQQWLDYLESINAAALTHHDIATKVLEKLMGKVDNPAWWAQSVTVSYEQYIGRRAPGQQPDGMFQTSISRATSLAMNDLIDAWALFADNDAEVQSLITTDTRVSGTDKRISWRSKLDSNVAISIISEPKPHDTASIIVQLTNIPSKQQSDSLKATWKSIIDRFHSSLND